MALSKKTKDAFFWHFPKAVAKEVNELLDNLELERKHGKEIKVAKELHKISSVEDDVALLSKRLYPFAYKVKFTVGAEAADVISVSMEVLNARYRPSGVKMLAWYFASSADGLTFETSAPGAVSAGANGDIKTTDKLEGYLTCTGAGKVDMDVTQTGAATRYLVVVTSDGALHVSPAITHTV